MDGDFFGQLSALEIEKKSRKWRTGQKRRFNEKRRTGGGAGINFGKAVSIEYQAAGQTGFLEDRL